MNGGSLRAQKIRNEWRLLAAEMECREMITEAKAQYPRPEWKEQQWTREGRENVPVHPMPDAATSTSTTAASSSVARGTRDKEGFIELPDLNDRVEQLLKLVAEGKIIEAAVEQLKTEISTELQRHRADGLTINGVAVISNKQDATPKWTDLQKLHPAIYGAYMVPAQRLDQAALRRDHPGLVEQVMGRSFKIRK